MTAIPILASLAVLAASTAFGQPSANAQTVITPLVASPVSPTITIQTAATGAMLRSQAADVASLDLGRVSYFRGSSAPGQSSEKSSGSFVISTRFNLRVDCPGDSAWSTVIVSMARLDGADSHSITIDGVVVGAEARTLRSMHCGSGSEHRLTLEVPASTPPGSIGSTVAFAATLDR